MRRWSVLVGLAVLIPLLASGCTGRTSSGNRQVDPAVRAAAAITALERTPLPVTPEQAARLLPLFRALRGTPAEDRPAVAALVRQIDAILTDAQRAALRRLREQRRPGGPGAPDATRPPGPGAFGPGGTPPGGPPPAFGPGGPSGSGPGAAGRPGGGQASPERIAAFRGQLLDRALAVLEDRAQALSAPPPAATPGPAAPP